MLAVVASGIGRADFMRIETAHFQIYSIGWDEIGIQDIFLRRSLCFRLHRLDGLILRDRV